MALSALVLGVISIAINVAILLLVGVLVLWVCSMFGLAIPDQARKLYLLIVALYALYLAAALLFGLPSVGFIHLR